MPLRLATLAPLLGLALLMPGLVEAQRMPASRFTRATTLPPAGSTAGTATRSAPLELEQPVKPPAPVGPQLLGGFVGFVIGGAIGWVGAEAADAYYMTAIINVAAAAAIGTTVGVHVVSRRHGLRAPVAATFLGAVLGLAALPGAPIVSPLLATGAYNLFRRAR